MGWGGLPQDRPCVGAVFFWGGLVDQVGTFPGCMAAAKAGGRAEGGG